MHNISFRETEFFYVLTRTFSSDAVESMFSNIRIGGGSQDVTDDRAAHFAIKRIIQSGLVTFILEYLSRADVLT
jgi:hypothetical protein